MTNEQKKLYDMYSNYGYRAKKRIDEIDKKLADESISANEFKELYDEKQAMRARISWAGHERWMVEHAQEEYERYMKKAADIKKKYGL